MVDFIFIVFYSDEENYYFEQLKKKEVDFYCGILNPSGKVAGEVEDIPV
jgi:hypothetical protein